MGVRYKPTRVTDLTSRHHGLCSVPVQIQRMHTTRLFWFRGITWDTRGILGSGLLFTHSVHQQLLVAVLEIATRVFKENQISVQGQDIGLV